MSVIIKDMDMPRNCVMCELCVEDDQLRDRCKLTGKYIGDFDKKARHPECPLMHTDSVYEVAYAEGANEAWRCAEKVTRGLLDSELNELFDTWDWCYVFDRQASDVMRIIHEYEAEKERKAPHIGDEFESNADGTKIVVFAIDADKYTCWSSQGEMLAIAKDDIAAWHKTGVNHPEVSSLITSSSNVAIQKGEKI